MVNNLDTNQNYYFIFYFIMVYTSNLDVNLGVILHYIL
jgi:hypothetical protein